MVNSISLYNRCHGILKTLNSSDLAFIDNDVKYRLKNDKAIIETVSCIKITDTGRELYYSNHYLDLAQKEQIKERGDIVTQRSTESTINQEKNSLKSISYQKATLIFSIIGAIAAVISAIEGCAH